MPDPDGKSIFSDFWKMKEVYARHRPVSVVPNSKRKKRLDKILSILRRKPANAR